MDGLNVFPICVNCNSPLKFSMIRANVVPIEEMAKGEQADIRPVMLVCPCKRCKDMAEKRTKAWASVKNAPEWVDYLRVIRI